MTQINLLPWREKARKKLKIELGILFAICITFTLIIILIVHLILSGFISHENARGAFLQQNVGDRTAAFQAQKAKKKKQDAMESELGFLYTLRNNSYSAVQLINDLAILAPSTIVLDKVIKENNKIIIDGQTQTELEITLFMKNLSQSNHFKQPVLTRISETPDKVGVTRVFELKVEQKNEAS